MTRSPADRSHLSIGEVLSLLQDEFPDVTISKIRFLESQGLLDPERTPSGYRKFYDADIQRLRWILRQQKDHYLPLKVIKDRLDGVEDLSELDTAPAAAPAEATPAAPAAGGGRPRRAAVNGNGRGAVAVDDRPNTAVDADADVDVEARAVPADAVPADAPAATAGRAAEGRHRARDGRTGRAERAAEGRARPASRTAAGRADARDGDRPDALADGAGASVNGQGTAPHPDAIPVDSVLVAGEAPIPTGPLVPPTAAAPPGPGDGADPSGGPGGPGVPGAGPPRSHPSAGTAGRPQPMPSAPPTPVGEAPVLAGYADLARYADLADAPGTAVSLTIDELAEASGMTVRDLRDLERYGLLESHVVGDAAYYDADSLVVARTAGGFLRHGIEARHLRSYKVAVDREAGLFEQIVLPLLKQRNPEAHRRANRIVAELVHLGEAMRGTLLRRELRDHID